MVALLSTRRYGVAVNPTINAVVVASPSHCRCAVMVVMQRQPMLGARARHQRSRPCRRTRCPCSRSRRHRVGVAPLWSRCSDHCRRRGHLVIALLLCSRGHVAVRLPPHRRCIAVLPPSQSCCGHRGCATATELPLLQPSLPSWLHCHRVAIASPLRRCGRGAKASMLGVGRSRGTNAHGLVSARVVLACGCVAVAPLLLRCHCFDHCRRCGHPAITLS